MILKNPCQPPLPVKSAQRPFNRAEASPFVSAEDFDRTGILAGMDPCESRYWWMPELYGPEPVDQGDAAAALGIQATRRPTSRTIAAA